jgi:hypothetical protein
MLVCTILILDLIYHFLGGDKWQRLDVFEKTLVSGQHSATLWLITYLIYVFIRLSL